ncbi:general secretion pathway protein GspM [Vibrio panuliri]|uniref:Type II secretion system protein M n=1 Tax=Vibrio panuliri TaxID=1381081 RepID=A0A1Q9HAC2_9VIBR|nr:type II secretion system protein M [Vibrio panuliri]OLQ86074.1 general secretion pathway protein GspM [Vibrio panuliri]
MKNILSSLQVWWYRITPRERRLVLVGSVVLGFGVLYWGIYQPVAQRAEQAQLALNSEKQLLSWVQDKADQIIELRGSGAKAISPLPLNQAIPSSARRFNVEMVRVQPRGNEMQVWVQPLPFNQLVSWIEYMQTHHGIEVLFLDIDKSNRAGVVEVKRLQLRKG